MDEFIWLPDWNAQGAEKADITKVRFGDGYVQRQTKGMNPITETWNLSFDPRSDAITDAILAFLRARKGVTAFTWTPPGGVQAKWTCDSWTKTKRGEDVNGLVMTFEKVYEP